MRSIVFICVYTRKNKNKKEKETKIKNKKNQGLACKQCREFYAGELLPSSS